MAATPQLNEDSIQGNILVGFNDRLAWSIRRLAGIYVALWMLALAALATPTAASAGTATTALAATIAAASTGPSSCAEGDALQGLGRLDAAEAAYLKELGIEATAECARRGLAQLGRRTESCTYAKALEKAGEDKSAHDAYLKVLAADPSSRCASAGASRTAESTSPWSWLGTAATNAGRALGAVLIAVLVLAILLLVFLQFHTRIPWLRDHWPARSIRRPTLEIKALDDTALSDRLGPAVAGLIRGRVSWRRDRFGVNLVSGQAGIATALSGLGDASVETKAAVAVINFLTALLPRRHFLVAGELQPAGKEGPGISLELGRENGFEALITFWARPLGLSGDPTQDMDVYRSLAVASAAWVDHWMVRTVGGGDLLTGDPQSWAYFRCGLDAQRLGDEERARILYDQALVMDGANVGAMANLGIIYRRRNQYQDAQRNLLDARKATEDSEVAPKLEPQLNPDWYRIRYQLAALYTNWTAATPAGVQHDNRAKLATEEATGLATDTLHAISEPQGGGILDSTPKGFVDETLQPFLEGTIEPSVLVLVACTVDPVPASPAERPASRPTRSEILEVLAKTPIDPWPLIAYVEMGNTKTPNALFDLACFYASADDIATGVDRLMDAVRDTLGPERKGLIDVAQRDPTLKSLRDTRPGLIPKLEKLFVPDVKLDAESEKLVKQFDLQTRAHEEAVESGWDVTWMPADSHFAMHANKGSEWQLIELADVEELDNDHIAMTLGKLTMFRQDNDNAPARAVIIVLKEVSADYDDASDRGVDVRRL
jgi:tetratricopeptide (TPR) repeat protein